MQVGEAVESVANRFEVRVGRVGQGADTSDLQPLDHCTSVIVRANPGLWIGLLGDRAFATHVASEAAQLDPGMLDEEVIDDGMGEFINILAGNTLALLESRGIDAELEPPQAGVIPAAGTRIDLAVGTGRAILVPESVA